MKKITQKEVSEGESNIIEKVISKSCQFTIGGIWGFRVQYALSPDKK
jgi:hypothetical protein